MIQKLLSKYLFPAAGISIIILSLGLAVQSWRLDKANTENETLALTIEVQEKNIQALSRAEGLRRNTSKKLATDREALEKRLARNTAIIEGEEDDAPVDPRILGTIDRLYRQ